MKSPESEIISLSLNIMSAKEELFMRSQKSPFHTFILKNPFLNKNYYHIRVISLIIDM